MFDKEKVYHVSTPKSYVFLRYVLKGQRLFNIPDVNIPVPAKEHYFLPRRKFSGYRQRGIEIIGTMDVPKYIKELERIFDEKIGTQSLFFVKFPVIPSSEWEVDILTKIPENAVPLKIEKKQVDKVISAYKAKTTSLIDKLRNKEEINLLERVLRRNLMLEPTETEIDFYRICEEVFLRKN